MECSSEKAVLCGQWLLFSEIGLIIIINFKLKFPRPPHRSHILVHMTNNFVIVLFSDKWCLVRCVRRSVDELCAAGSGIVKCRSLVRAVPCG